MLYLVATPLGHLEDITLRALRLLKECAYILCEDTRKSRILLQEYGIKTLLKSFHLFNEKEAEDRVVHDLKKGLSIALISDAGTPGICDPGEALVRRCYEEGLPFTGVPGPCAAALALALSPFSKTAVQFVGFLPKKEGERVEVLAALVCYPGTSIFYEAPHRLVSSLELLPADRQVCVLRELTKMHEEHRLGKARALADYYAEHPPRGECVVLVEQGSFHYEELSLVEHVELLEQLFSLELAEAIKLVAHLRGIPKRDVYHEVHR